MSSNHYSSVWPGTRYTGESQQKKKSIGFDLLLVAKNVCILTHRKKEGKKKGEGK